MENEEQRRDGKGPAREEVRKALRKTAVRGAAAVLLILAGIALILFGIWAQMLAGWGGEDVPSELVILLGVLVIALAIGLLVSKNEREEQS
jgi:hypothetical protein